MRRPLGLRGWLGALGLALAIVVAGTGVLLGVWLYSLGGAASADASSAETSGEGPTPVVTSEPVATTTTEPAPIRITIAAVGDVMGVGSVQRAAWDASAKRYDFYPMLKPLAPYLEGADYTVCNFETRLAKMASGDGQMILNSPPELGDALKKAGFDLCALANNHSVDKGFTGVVQTIERLDAIGLAHIGCYVSAEDKQARSPFIVDIKGVKVAFINYTDVSNGLPLASQHRGYTVNFLGAEAAAAEAQAARAAGADVVIMIVHWGKERKTQPNGAQTEVAEGAGDYQGLLQRGVDVILGAHPHVVQPAARVTYQTAAGPRDTYVVYSMGNFLPPASAPWPEDSGLVMYVHIEKQGDNTKVTGLSYLPVVRQTVGGEIRLLPVLPGVTPLTDTEVGSTTQARMERAWNYYKDMYDKPEENIAPLDPAGLEHD